MYVYSIIYMYTYIISYFLQGIIDLSLFVDNDFIVLISQL